MKTKVEWGIAWSLKEEEVESRGTSTEKCVAAERHDGKLCGTQEQAQTSIRSSWRRLWRSDKTHQLSYSFSWQRWVCPGLPLAVCRATALLYTTIVGGTLCHLYCVLHFLYPSLFLRQPFTPFSVPSFCMTLAPLMWLQDKGRRIIIVVSGLLPFTHGGGVYWIRLVGSVLTLCERHFSPVTHE